MSIKNLGTYYCKIKNIEKKELKQYMNYLLNDDHNNHQDTEVLNNTMNSEEIRKYLIRSDLKIKTNTDNYKKGVKLKVSEKSLTLNIPPSYKPSKKDLITIQEEMLVFIKNMYLEGGFDISEDIFSNIHNQGNPHINCTLPYLDDNGKTIRLVKSRDFFFKKVAKHFTKIVDKTLNTNIKDYKTQSELDLIDILKDFSMSLIEYGQEEQKEIVGHFKTLEKEGNIEGIKSMVNKMKDKVNMSEMIEEYKNNNVSKSKGSNTNQK